MGGLLVATVITFTLAIFTTLVIEKTAHKLLPKQVGKPVHPNADVNAGRR